MQAMRGMVVLLGLLLVGCGAVDVEGPHGIVGVMDEGYFYVVPVEGGVVVVDAGGNTDGQKLKDAVAGRTVKAILITHGHPDHVGGAHHLPGVPTLAHHDDVGMIQGVTRPGGILPAVFTAASTWPPPEPDSLQGIEDGHVFSVGADTFTAIHVPGHTPGSVVWHYRDVIFGGDAVLGGPRLVSAGPLFDEDTALAQESVQRLKDLDFTTLLDGHTGRTDDAKSRL